MKEGTDKKGAPLIKSVIRSYKIAILILLLTSVFPPVLFIIITATVGMVVPFLFILGAASLTALFCGFLLGILFISYLHLISSTENKILRTITAIIGFLSTLAGFISFYTHKTGTTIDKLSSTLFALSLIAFIALNIGLKKQERAMFTKVDSNPE